MFAASSGLLFSAVPTLLLLSGASAAATSTACRCLSTDSCWPSAAEFAQFNKTVSGNLIHVAPPGAVCYPGTPGYNATACANIQNNYYNAYVRQEIPGASMYPKNEGLTDDVVVCSLTPSPGQTCQYGRVSILGVAASSVADVQATVKFAAAKNLRLAIKNTGHDQTGRSFATGSLQLWTHKMKGIEFSSSFKPHNCPSQGPFSAVTLQAGEQWGDVYAAADAVGLVVVGGAASTVGSAGGYTQAGGHGPLSRSYGMAADQVLEFTVVTANGQVQTVNACNNPELFWALRGGGGGTFGVVTSLTVKTYPSPATATAIYIVAATSPSQNTSAFMKTFVDNQPAFAASGVSGYIGFSPGEVTLELIQPNGTAATLAAAANIVLANASAQGYFVYGETFANSSFYKAYHPLDCLIWPTSQCSDTVGTNVAIGSRLIPTSLFATQSSKDKLFATMTNVLAQSGYFLIHLVTGGEVASVAPDYDAVLPAWRNSLWHLLVANTFATNATAAQANAVHAATTAQVKLLTDLAPESGAYINEADRDEPNWQKSFFGDHYPRLLAIKEVWDPLGLFTCWKCVGSEQWSADGNCRV